jgi:hypothetical protein
MDMPQSFPYTELGFFAVAAAGGFAPALAAFAILPEEE